ncbi:hypothetical protein L484_022312 [Morus notabilis]|uniref:MD-2-related lipid-recognition domain-containing protein n=1 Tax=Morus notabilis TaxID=981085 RepID=W9QU24_9ROSA|nr:hypothetical protein L484_022312 [Morus notabilis]
MASPTYQKKLSFVVLFSSLFLLLPSAQSTNVKYCDKKGKYDVKVKGVEISPDPVVSGEPATFNIAASTVSDFWVVMEQAMWL